MQMWRNGKLIDEQSVDAMLSPKDHAHHYGDAAFDGLKFYLTVLGIAVFRLREHVERLIQSAKTAGMISLWSVEEIMAAILETVKASGLETGYVRPIMYFGPSLTLLPGDDLTVNLDIIIEAWGKYSGTASQRLTLVSTQRLSPSAFDIHAKIGGHYVNSIRAQREARKAGFNDALLLDTEGEIAEAPVANIFLVTKNRLFTPATKSILPGITRATVITLAQDLGVPTDELGLPTWSLGQAQEAFLTGTAIEVLPVGSVHGCADYGSEPGPVTRRIIDLFERVIHGEEERYHHWLSPIA